MVDKSLINVILLGVSFMLIFTAFQTMGNIQKTIITSIAETEDKSLNGKAYYSLAIIYAFFSIFNWAAPSVISMIGPKFSMIFGGVTYLVFIMAFLILKTWILFLVSAIIGIGAAMIWTGQGNYLTLNSTKALMTRNSGIFWSLLQLSMFIGNLFVFFAFKNKETIDKSTRNIVIWTLSAVALIGLIVMCLLPKPTKEKEEDEESTEEEEVTGPVEALFKAGRLFFTRNMLLLTLTFLYTGLELGFYSGVYSSCIGFTKSFENSKELVGLSGIFIGLGEVLGGAVFGIFGKKTIKWGRDPIVGCGFIIHAISFFIIFLNLPNDSPFQDTTKEAYITSNAPLAIFCSFMLGLGDACYNTQIFSLLGAVYSDKSAPAFAIFKFTQSIGAAISFVYAEELILYGQLAVLIVFGVLGTISFIVVEWQTKKLRKLVPSET